MMAESVNVTPSALEGGVAVTSDATLRASLHGLAAHRVYAALADQVGEFMRRQDLAGAEQLARGLNVLIDSQRIVRSSPVAAPAVDRHSRSRPSSWRRPHAPVVYPYGTEPAPLPRAQDGHVTPHSAQGSAASRARLAAYQRDQRER